MEAPLLGTRRGTLIAAVAGILFPVLSVTRIFLTHEIDLPTWNDSREAIATAYSNAAFDGAFKLGIAMVTIGYMLLIVFVAKMASVVGDVDGGSRWVGHVIVGAAVVNIGFGFGYVAAVSTGTFWASNGGLSPEGYLVVHGIAYAFYWLAVIAADGLLLTTLGIAIVVTRRFPRWLGWAMIMTSAVELASSFGSADTWNAGGGLIYVWVLIAAAIMLMRADRYSNPDPLRPVKSL